MNRRTFLSGTSVLGALTLAGCLADDELGSDTDDTPTPDSADDATPAITGSSIERTATGCATHEGDEGTQTPETEYARTSTGDSTLTVSVTGQLITSNPCYLPTIEALEYDDGTDRLTITVGTEREDGVCIDCVGVVEFAGTVEFEGGVPGDVAVVHDGVTLTPDDGSAQPTDGGSASGEPTTLQADSFSVTDVSSGSPANTADASFDDDTRTVSVTGSIIGRNGCMTAALGSVTYDAKRDRLEVDVVSTEREDSGMCTQQLVGIDYEATFSFGGGIPSQASVSHDGDGVTTAAYGSRSTSAPGPGDNSTPNA